MRLWTAASECCRRAGPGWNLQLHAMPTADWRSRPAYLEFGAQPSWKRQSLGRRDRGSTSRIPCPTPQAAAKKTSFMPAQVNLSAASGRSVMFTALGRGRSQTHRNYIRIFAEIANRQVNCDVNCELSTRLRNSYEPLLRTQTSQGPASPTWLIDSRSHIGAPNLRFHSGRIYVSRKRGNIRVYGCEAH